MLLYAWISSAFISWFSIRLRAMPVYGRRPFGRVVYHRFRSARAKSIPAPAPLSVSSGAAACAIEATREI